jgi:Fe(3+) dicitrate transport protein
MIATTFALVQLLAAAAGAVAPTEAAAPATDPRGYDGVVAITSDGDVEMPVPAEPRAAPPPSVPPTRPTPPLTTTEAPEIRRVRVTTDALGGSTRAAAFKHAGARTIVDVAQHQARGSASVGEVLDRTPGVRAPEGIAGTSGATRLNVAVRGANPRLSSDATVLLDEVPISMAPYGEPELSLFPVSPFSIETIDAVRSGASVRFGPKTMGGVFNLVTKPIPLDPEIKIASRVDQWGQYQGAASFGATVGRTGVYVEYAPQLGRTYREHSDIAAHGGLLKLAWDLGSRVDLQSTTHGYHENAQLPGGLSRAEYDEDPFQSTKTDDAFEGWRVGEALKLRVRPRDDQEFGTIFFYNHSYRQTTLEHYNTDIGLVRLPRTYDVVGLEPRYTIRLKHKRGPYHDLAFGIRGVLEINELLRFASSEPGGPTADDDGRLGALAAFAEDELHLLDDALIVRAGVRGEVARISYRQNLEAAAGLTNAVRNRTYAVALPSASIHYEPIDGFAIFTGYSRSFGAPTFVTLQNATNDERSRDPEIADTVELGVKIEELGGVYGEATGWYRHYDLIRDVGFDSSDIVGSAHAGGVELDVEWELGEVWDPMTASSLYGGYAYMTSRIYDSLAFEGNKLPWYPAHEAWGGGLYAFPWRCSFFRSFPGPDDCRMLKLGVDVTYSAKQYSYFTNDETDGPPNGSTGIIPAYWLLDVYVKFTTLFPKAWVVNLAFGVKNVANEPWFYRTDDLNRGILAQRPRTFYVALDIAYTFFGAHARAEARRKARKDSRRR